MERQDEDKDKEEEGKTYCCCIFGFWEWYIFRCTQHENRTTRFFNRYTASSHFGIKVTGSFWDGGKPPKRNNNSQMEWMHGGSHWKYFVGIIIFLGVKKTCFAAVTATASAAAADVVALNQWFCYCNWRIEIIVCIENDKSMRMKCNGEIHWNNLMQSNSKDDEDERKKKWRKKLCTRAHSKKQHGISCISLFLVMCH